jgi:peptidoglycan/xylan/chitin deacetylase (PgdA/CDA1 family)
MFEYGSRVGYWRLRRLFRERGMPFTAFACALALERNPEIARSIREDGTDICCHGWRWVFHATMDEAEEARHIDRAVASLAETLGEAPPGWYCRYGPSPNTRRLLVRKGGFLYDSDSYADELPYWTQVDGSPHLIVPYSLTTNDGKFAHGIGTGSLFFEFLRDQFDMLYAEGATQPKMLSVGLHMRIVGHPARASGLARFLDHVAGREDVWVTSRLGIAEHWHRHHPWTGRGGR